MLDKKRFPTPALRTMTEFSAVSEINLAHYSQRILSQTQDSTKDHEKVQMTEFNCYLTPPLSNLT